VVQCENEKPSCINNVIQVSTVQQSFWDHGQWMNTTGLQNFAQHDGGCHGLFHYQFKKWGQLHCTYGKRKPSYMFLIHGANNNFIGV
jgi:hypothetical protein